MMGRSTPPKPPGQMPSQHGVAAALPFEVLEVTPKKLQHADFVGRSREQLRDLTQRQSEAAGPPDDPGAPQIVLRELAVAARRARGFWKQAPAFVQAQRGGAHAELARRFTYVEGVESGHALSFRIATEGRSTPARRALTNPRIDLPIGGSPNLSAVGNRPDRRRS